MKFYVSISLIALIATGKFLSDVAIAELQIEATLHRELAIELLNREEKRAHEPRVIVPTNKSLNQTEEKHL